MDFQMKSNTHLLVILLLQVTVKGDVHIANQWLEVLEFWTNAICTIQETRTISIHEIFINKFSIKHLFFRTLVRSVGERCSAVILLNTYISYNSQNVMNKSQTHGLGHERVNLLLTHFKTQLNISPKPYFPVYLKKIINQTQKQRHFFDIKTLHVIILGDKNSFKQFLDQDVLTNRGAQLHYIVLIIRDINFTKYDHSVLTVKDILQPLWLRYKIQNVFLAIPFSNNKKSTIYTYNPFEKVNNNEWGIIESFQVESSEYMFELLSTLTSRRIRNMNGYPINVGLFNKFYSKILVKPPLNSVYRFSGGYNGTDGIVLGTIAKHMNFSVNVIKPIDGIGYGIELSNGTYIGTIGDVIYGRVDVAFVSFFVKRYGKNMSNFEFTRPMALDKICVVVPKAHQIPKWLRIYHMFKPSIWIFSTISQITVLLTWYILRKFNIYRNEIIDFQSLMCQSIMINVGWPLKLTRLNSEKILLVGVLLAGVTVIGLFNGLLYKSFAQDMYYKDINTLYELDASELPIIYTSYSLIDVFGSSDDPDLLPYLTALRSKLKQGESAINHAAYYRNASALIKLRHYNLIREDYIDEHGSPLIHLVKECIGTYYLAYLLPRNSYLRERFNEYIGKLNQAGLTTFWSNRTIQHLFLKKISSRKTRMQRDTDFVTFKLDDMHASFYMLIIGLFLSFIIFCYEKKWLYISKMRS